MRSATPRIAILAACLCAASVAKADTYLTWTLENVSFFDGATATGSFVEDTTTQTLSSWNITTTAGTGLDNAGTTDLSGYTYNASNSALVTNSNSGFLVRMNATVFDPLSNNQQNPTLNLQFGASLALTSSNNALIPGNGSTLSSYECLNCNPYRNVVAGYATTNAPVPEPAEAWLLLGGLACAGVFARGRRTA